MSRLGLILAALLFATLGAADAQQICCSGGGGGGVTYPLTASNGSSSAPSYSFSSASASGLYAPTNGAVTVTGTNAGGATGGAATVTGGQPASGDFSGGTLTLTGGTAGPSATAPRKGGDVAITSGNGLSNSANSGDITLTIPVVSGFGSGKITVTGGDTGNTTDGLTLQTNGGQITLAPLKNPLGGGSVGATVNITGGIPADSSSSGGGPVNIKGGTGATAGVGAGPGGTVTVSGGVAAEGDGGTVTITGSAAGTAGSTAHNGGNVNLTAGAASGTGTVGEVQINGDGAIMEATIGYQALDPTNRSFFTATRAVLVKAIVCRENAATGAAATMSIFKVGSGTAISGGTLLHSGSYNANSTANTNQTLTLSATIADRNLAAGDSLGVTTTGTWTVGTGSCTVHLQPK